ncbi:MAG: SDR family NAD(P)-dependent oxidoreductase [Planctomycetota bacterium]|nr:SDR family NAD(P)-dependent oxidoreductase [Planctomycetota bacterium]
MTRSKVAWITGAGRGIGRAIALALARERIASALLARTGEEIDEVARKIGAGGGRAVAYRCDLARTAEILETVERIRGDLGPADILVNNAGIALSRKLEETTDEDWEAAIRLNMTVPFILCREVIPAMIGNRWGRIVNIASTAGKVGYRYTAAYTASKHGLVGLTRSLALDVKKHGITVNAVCPGWVNTAMTDESVRNIAERTGMDEEKARATLARMNPGGRLIEPEEVAAAVVRLIGDDSDAITGQAIDLDAGNSSIAPAVQRTRQEE